MLGRDRELDTLLARADLAAAGEGAAVEIAGPAGQGKSTLVAAAIERLRDRGFTVLAHTATRPEQRVPWSGLSSLLAPADARWSEELAPGLRAHLASVLSPDPAVEVSAHGVSIAVRELLAPASRSGPLALVVDDEHWLDASSAAALTVACRAVADHAVLLVRAGRTEEASTIDLSALPAERRHRVELTGLPLDTLAELLRPLLGSGQPKSTLRSMWEQSAGNPMLALEMARQLASGEPLDRALTPRSIVESMRPRLAALPPSCLRALQLAGLLAPATVDDIGAVLGSADPVAELAAAERAGLIEIAVVRGTPPTVRFAHPTVAAAALAVLSTSELRAAHAALAAVVADPERRAVHLAESAPGRDPHIADELEAGGMLASQRGSSEGAARLLRASVDATPEADVEARHRRLMALARAQSIGAEHRELLDTIAEIDAPAGSIDADRLATMRIAAVVSCEGADAARPVALESCASMSTPRGRTVAFAQLVYIERLGDFARGLDAARRSADDAAANGDADGIETATLSLDASLALLAEPVDVDARLAAAAHWSDDTLLGFAMEELALLLWCTGDPRAEGWVERMREAAVSAGDAVTEINALGYLGEVLIPRGELERAERAMRFSGVPNFNDVRERATLGFLLATTGRKPEARAVFAELAAGAARHDRTDHCSAQIRRAMSAHALGDPDAAEQLELADRLATDVSLRAPRLFPYRRDLVEAYVAAGRLDDAAAAAERLSADADRCCLANARADADAAAAVVAAATGDDDRAAELFDGAAKVHERDGDLYELARTLLAAGKAARRANRRTDARRMLDGAAALFEAMGATPWRQRCDAERARIGGRPRRSAQLTPTEQQVAERAAAGATNAEIAAAMFVTVRTVESNLSRCYRKLGIRSRVELAAALTRR